MFKAYKYKLKPTKEQEQKIVQFCGCARFIYNWALNRKSEHYTETSKTISLFDLEKEVTKLKREEGFGWLKEAHAQMLQSSLKNLDIAYTSFFKKKNAFPKFKKKSSHQSFQYPQGVKTKNNKIYLPKIGWVKYFNSREFEGKIKTVTVSTTPTGKYFVSVLVDDKKELPLNKKVRYNTAVGCDMGIKDLLITSDGEVFQNQRNFDNWKIKLRVEQRSLSRKQKGSNNWYKQKLVVAKIHEKITNTRKDYLHKISNQLVKEYDTICLEDLSIEKLLKEKKMSKLISDASWATLRTFIEYKAKWNGNNLSIIGRYYPSSKTCSGCGNIKKDLKLSDRVYVCNKCKTTIDRDINAAINIKSQGVGQILMYANVGH
jgi:putative transposase